MRDHVAPDILLHTFNFFRCAHDGLIDAALEGHWVRAGGNGLHAFAEDRLREDGRRRCAVTRHVRRLGGNFANHLCAHVFECVLQFNLLGDCDTVFRDSRGAKLLVNDHVATLRPERNLDRFSELIDSSQDRRARLFAVNYLFCHLSFSPAEMLNVFLLTTRLSP